MSFKALEHHLHPRSPSEVAAEIASHDAHDAYLVCTGQYSPLPAETERVLVLGLREGHPTQLCADAWMKPDDLEDLAGLMSCSHVRRGRCDAMYATSWALAWASDAGSVEVWDAHGRILWQQDQVLWHRVRGPLSQPREARAVLGAGWIERSLLLELEGAPSCVVASSSDSKAALDPTYDALDLMMDASWLVELTRELSQRLGIPSALDPALL